MLSDELDLAEGHGDWDLTDRSDWFKKGMIWSMLSSDTVILCAKSIESNLVL